MKAPSLLLLPAFIGAAAAAVSDTKVYLFQGLDRSAPSTPPVLSPEEARLVFAQRLQVSQYHGIGDASESALAHVNAFGGHQGSIFQESERNKAAELIIFVQTVSSKTAEPILKAWSSLTPAFTISNPPSSESNLKFVEDLQHQVGQGKACVLKDDIHPLSTCWNGKSTRAIYMILSPDADAVIELMDIQKQLIEFAKDGEMNAMVVLMPKSGSSKISKPYGLYELPSQTTIGRRQAEEPMSSSTASNSKQVVTSNTEPDEPITGVPPVCHTSLDSCTNATNKCSGHGECYMKYGATKDKPQPCYTCGCVPTEEEFLSGSGGKKGFRITYWGGAACQKKDVSGPFWLIAIFTVVMVGLVSWSIGLLFSIGEEKLPGVIGAGVPSKSR